IRLPKSRPCMSVKALTTVSIVPASASERSSSTLSIPALPPGPPGRSPMSRSATWLDVAGHLVLFERADGALVAVLRAHQVPDAEDERQDDRERRVVDVGRVELLVPRHGGRGVGQGERIDHDYHVRGRQPGHEPVMATEVPGSGLDRVA